MTSGRFPLPAALKGAASGPPSKNPLVFPPLAQPSPAGRFPLVSRHQQRSIALSHIRPLPIPRGLKYQLGSRMYLGVVHLRPEARGQPFPRSPRSRSRVNLRVLRPLPRVPQGQPSALRTLHGRPGIQGIFPTSRGHVSRACPRVPHCMATGFPVPQVCCLVFAVLLSLSLCFRRPGMSVSPLPHPANGPVPIPLPSSRVYTPPGRQQPHGAGPMDPHPSGDPFVRPIPPPCDWVVCVLLETLGTLLSGPAPICHPITRAYTPPGRLHPMCILHPAAYYPVALARGSITCLLRKFFLSIVPLPFRSVLCVLWRGIDFFFSVFFCAPRGPLPPPFSSACPVLCFPVWAVFRFYPPPCMHARQHCTVHRVTAPLCVCLWSSHQRGACPLAVPGHASLAPLCRVLVHLTLSSPLLVLPPSPVSRPSPYCSSPAQCALRCSSPRQGCISRALTRFSRLHPVLCPVGRLGRPPQEPLRGDFPVIRPRRPPLHEFPDGGAGRPVRLNAGQRHGITLWAM